MPHLTTNRWLGLAFAASVIAAGFPCWRAPYGTVKLPGALIGPGLAVLAAATLFARAGLRVRVLRTLLVMGGVLPVVVLLRVLVDVARDGSTHTLWPLEVAVVLPLAVRCVLPGVIIDGAVAALWPAPSSLNAGDR